MRMVHLNQPGFDRRRLIGAAAGALLAPFAPFATSPLAAALGRIAIGANPAGTNFNLVAGGFAKVLQETLGIPSIVRPYAGSSVYIPMLERGELALGINSSIDSYLAFSGEPPYPAPMRKLRTLLSVYPLAYMYWTRADAGLATVGDLAGRRVVLNYRGLVPLDRLNRAILATAGLDEDDVVAVTAAGLPEGARLVAEGRADAVAMGYRLPLVRQMDAAIPGGIRFLTLGPDEHRIAEIMPGAGAIDVGPGAGTVGIGAPSRLAVYDTYLNTGTHVDADDARAVVAAIHAAWPSLRRDYAVLEPVDADALSPAAPPLPYHGGAAAYWEESGRWTEAHADNQQRLLGV